MGSMDALLSTDNPCIFIAILSPLYIDAIPCSANTIQPGGHVLDFKLRESQNIIENSRLEYVIVTQYNSRVFKAHTITWRTPGILVSINGVVYLVFQSQTLEQLKKVFENVRVINNHYIVEDIFRGVWNPKMLCREREGRSHRLILGLAVARHCRARRR